MTDEEAYIARLRTSIHEAIDRLHYTVIRAEELLACLAADKYKPLECSSKLSTKQKQPRRRNGADKWRAP